MQRLITLAITSLWLGHAAAASYVSMCNGCDLNGMYDAAARETTKGTVYVFDLLDGDARKFKVETEIISLRPYWAQTWGDEVPIETSVKSAFQKYATTQGLIEENPTIPMPPDFKIRSVAGVMLDPGAATVRIVDYLRAQQTFSQLAVNTNTLIAALIKVETPIANIREVLKTTKIIIEMPDGSTTEFEIFLSINASNLTAALELKYIGNSRLANGDPAPTAALGFDGFVSDNGTQSLREWVMWAAYHKIPIGGSELTDNSVMTCKFMGSFIQCTLVKKL